MRSNPYATIHICGSSQRIGETSINRTGRNTEKLPLKKSFEIHEVFSLMMKLSIIQLIFQ